MGRWPAEHFREHAMSEEMAKDREASSAGAEAAAAAPGSSVALAAQTPGSGSVTAQGQAIGTPLSGQILPPKRSKRRLVLPLVLLAAIGGGGWAGYKYLTEWQFLVSTDDAYVRADTSILAAKVPGYVQAVAVTDNSRVKAGDVLVQIDDGDFRLAVQSAKDKLATQDAAIARIDQQIEAQAANIDQARAQVAAAQADAVRAVQAFDRANTLAKSSYGTQVALDQARADRDRTAAAVRSAAAAVDLTKANLAVLKAQKGEAQRTRGELETALAQAERDLAFTVVKAPFDGVIGNRAAQPGQYVTAGTRLLALVPLQSAYVEANFKETQLAHMAPGQKVDITVDAYPGRPIEGQVESLAPASGSQYSILPPENATGNFTKIVQRVPVRIRVPGDVAREGILRPGLSVVVDVHTRDERLPKPTLLGTLGLDKLDLSWLGLGASASPAPRSDLGATEAQR
jgi:membrane fusion protein (multidrug efflux system)